MVQIVARIARRPYALDPATVELRVRGELPEPLVDHFVVVGGRRFPPKQVISIVTGLDRADFTTHQSRQVLRRLGFTVGRRSAMADQPTAERPDRPGPHHGREADALRPHMGRWVAQRGLEVIVSAGTPQEVLAWLEQNNQQADAMFMVPVDTAAVSGAAPS